MAEDVDNETPQNKALSLPFQKRKQLERDLDHITEEMYRRNKELADTNKTLSLLRSIDALVMGSHTSVKRACEHITEAIAQATGYPFVGLFARGTTSVVYKQLTLYGWSGKNMIAPHNKLTIARPIHFDVATLDSYEPRSTYLISLEGKTPTEMANFLQIEVSEAEHLLESVPVKAIYVVRLQVRRRLVGLLVVGFSSTQPGENDTLLIERLSETVGVALDNKLLFEENTQVLRQLRESNVKLKALDETKDDFISMASHQLRTPLTSVKGYLSMIMEGDAGEINPTQQQMLQQAFFSSQRMVYLIADLLNVSRLKTGKFVIEPAEVNLADIVEQELAQLKDTAAARSLTLQYDKPKSFPTLKLDETKTRQVIMNFVDNAIYYTPAGGHVMVRLTDKPDTVELRVEDDGIGVPKSERQHLFTKFYRAGNARKARPDGTGLGLFMAKKVVIAQGGSVIFESEEGKGSTFGFLFNKHHINEETTPTIPDEPAAADPETT